MKMAQAINAARDKNIIDIAVFPDGTVAWEVARRWDIQEDDVDDVTVWLDSLGVTKGSALERLWSAKGYVVIDVPDGRGRIRATLTGLREKPHIVIRIHGREAPEHETLLWPDSIAEASDRSQGVLVLTGQGGSGKSSEGAALVRRASSQGRFCWLFESPNEFEQPSRLAQAFSVGPGQDFPTYAHGVVAAMTSSVNVVLVGQVNDAETAQAAFDLARLGKFVILTMLSGSVSQALDQLRIWGVTPHAQAELVVGVAALRLAAALGGSDKVTGLPLVPACEVWICDEETRAQVKDARYDDLHQLLRHRRQTLEDSLRALVDEGRVDISEARKLAVHPSEV